jgi:hypothetical protein
VAIKWWHDVIVEAVDHHWLLPTSILNIWNVSEHLHMLWICIWVHPYTVIPVEVAQIMASWSQHGYYEMMAWWHSASHIHIWFMKSVWAPSYAVDRHMGAPLHCYTGKVGPDFGNLGQCGYYEMMAWWHCWGYRLPLTAFHIYIGYIESVWAPSYAVDRQMGAPLHGYLAKLAQFGNLGSVWLQRNDGMMTFLRL